MMNTRGGKGWRAVVKVRASTSEASEANERVSSGSRAGTAAETASSKHDGALVIVGGGWGGLGVATAAARSGTKMKVTLVDALPMYGPDGDGSRRTPTGKPFEAGHRGFWRDYPNINDVIENTIGVSQDTVFTEFTTSAMYGPEGLEATAPVFGADNLASQLPSPIGQVAATLSNFKRIPYTDLLSFAGLLLAMLDYKRDDATFEKYDRMTAHELFIRFGLSKRLVDDFLRPTLLVGLFKPPEELSAAVTMELLYYYALAHTSSFDVRWMRSKSINEHMVVPLARVLVESHGLRVLDACRVERIVMAENDAVNAVSYRDRGGNTGQIENVSACVLAVGAKGMNAILRNSPELARCAPELPLAASLGAIDVISVRLWLDTYVSTRTPANVFSRSAALRGAGGTYFMLDQLQSDYEAELWNGEAPQGSVLACDFYGAGALCLLSASELVNLLVRDLLPEAEPQFGGVRVVDSHVEKYPQSVSWFSPGSYRKRPTIRTSVENIVCCGDWVRMEEREHGAKGLCQERAFVSGIQAFNELVRKGKVPDVSEEQPVIPIREDEPQYTAGVALNRQFRSIFSPFDDVLLR